MRIDIVTIFPEIFTPLEKSIIKRAREAELVDIYIHNLRDFTVDRHRTVDDEPFGGGGGMVMKVEPIFKALAEIRDLDEKEGRVILTSPQGRVLNQEISKELSNLERMIILCGHYEGIDERVLENLCDDEISIGDYVLTGGELPAMVIIDSVVRLIPGVIKEESALMESFSGGLLDYPQYTRPAKFNGWQVPEVLLSGNHREIEKWRNEERLRKTIIKRPDLLGRSKEG